VGYMRGRDAAGTAGAAQSSKVPQIQNRQEMVFNLVIFSPFAKKLTTVPIAIGNTETNYSADIQSETQELTLGRNFPDFLSSRLLHSSI